jgi:hypothetical protein
VNWDVSVAGELECEDCFTSDFVPESGTVTTGLLGLPGETSRVAFGFTFATFGPQADVVAEISGGSLVVDGDQSRAVTFGGPLDNQETCPGDELIIRFADRSDTTLEPLLPSQNRIEIQHVNILLDSHNSNLF